MAETESTQASRYRLLRVAQQRFGVLPAQLDSEQRRQATRIVERQHALEAAVLSSREAIGVVVADSHLERAWQQLLGESDAAALSAALDAAGLDQAALRAQLARDLRVEAVFERVCAGLPEIGDTEVSLYYFNHPERFELPALRRARHILITVNEDFAENRREQAWARIETIAQRLREKPSRFAEQAMKHSECPTALQGGELGEVRPGSLYPQLERALFELMPGQLGGPVESPLGFHLLRCDALLPARRLALEEVSERLRELLRERQHKARRRAWLEEIMQNRRQETAAHG